MSIFRSFAFLPVVALAGCGISSSNETVNLKSVGINGTIDLPKGGSTSKELLSGRPKVEYGTLGRHGSVSFSTGRSDLKGLGCSKTSTSCRVVKQTDSALVTSTDVDGKRVFSGRGVSAQADYTCIVTAPEEANAIRLTEACATMKAANAPTPTSVTQITQASVPAAKPAARELEAVSDAAMNYRIELPKGAKSLAKSSMQHSFAFPLPGGQSYDVSISPVPVKSLADAARHANAAGTQKIESQTEPSPGKYVIVMAPRFGSRDVAVYVKTKTGGLKASCSGPADDETLTKMCSSLSLAKP